MWYFVMIVNVRTNQICKRMRLLSMTGSVDAEQMEK
jgi:hypothetical protein